MEGMIVSQEERKEGDIVVAVDFGTSRSAALIATVERFDDIPTPVSLDGSSFSVIGNTKTPTSILMKEPQGLHFRKEEPQGLHFGAMAEELYAREGSKHSDWFLFKCFKMKLHTSFQQDPQVEAADGRKCLPLSIILRECFKLFKKRVEETLKGRGLERKRQFWVLTVPGIWSDFAKNMMRTAAFKAGLILAKLSGQLILTLEPECAAVSSDMWGENKKFMIMDCGGGTVDITFHSISQSQPLLLEELKPATGGPLGATLVDKEFFSFFSSLLGAKNYQKLEKNHPEEFLTLGRMWEEVKVGYNFEDEETPQPRLVLTDILAEIGLNRSDLQQMVECWNRDNPHLKLDMVEPRKVGVLLSHSLMHSFFDGLIKQIVDLALNEITDNLELNYLVLAGGFSKCQLLKRKFETVMREKKLRIITSKDADMAIVKGAALFGVRLDDVVSTRKARRTFGVSTSIEYLESNPMHQQYKHKTFVRSGKQRLQIFSVHGLINDDLEAQSGCLRRYSPVTRTQERVALRILVSSRRDVFLEDDKNIEVLAATRVPLDMSLPFEDRSVWVKFCFGGPEVKCRIFGPTKDQELGVVDLKFDQF